MNLDIINRSLNDSYIDLHSTNLISGYDQSPQSPVIKEILEDERKALILDKEKFSQVALLANQILSKPIFDQALPFTFNSFSIMGALSLTSIGLCLATPIISVLLATPSYLISLKERSKTERIVCQKMLLTILEITVNKVIRLYKYYDRAKSNNLYLQEKDAPIGSFLEKWEVMEIPFSNGIENTLFDLINRTKLMIEDPYIGKLYPKIKSHQNDLTELYELSTNLNTTIDTSRKGIFLNLNKLLTALKFNHTTLNENITLEMQKILDSISHNLSKIRRIIDQTFIVLSREDEERLKATVNETANSINELFKAFNLRKLIKKQFLPQIKTRRIESMCDSFLQRLEQIPAAANDYSELKENFKQLFQAIRKGNTVNVPGRLSDYPYIILQSILPRFITGLQKGVAERFHELEIQLKRIEMLYPSMQDQIIEILSNLDQLHSNHINFCRSIQKIKIAFSLLPKIDAIACKVKKLIQKNYILNEAKSEVETIIDSLWTQYRDNTIESEELQAFKQFAATRQRAFLRGHEQLRSGVTVSLGAHSFRMSYKDKGNKRIYTVVDLSSQEAVSETLNRRIS